MENTMDSTYETWADLMPIQIVARMQQEDMQFFVKHLTCRQLRRSDYCKIQQVTIGLHKGILDPVKQAIIYLENFNWNAYHASMQAEFDCRDRLGYWPPNFHGRPGHLQPANPYIDRSFIELGAAFDRAKLDLTFSYGSGGSQNELSRTISYPTHLRDQINVNDEEEVSNLNRWRHSQIYLHIGPALDIGRTGTKWSCLEETYVRNVFAYQDTTVGRANYDSVTKTFNVAFEGMFLPGAMEPCPQRSSGAVSSFINRTCLKKNNGKPVPQGLPIHLLYLRAVNAIKSVWEANLERDLKDNKEQLMYEE